MEALAALAPFIITASLGILAGAGLGYFTGYTDAMRERAPRYRRVGRPE